MLAIVTIPDHVHILTGYNVNQLIPDLVEEIKTSSNIFIKGKRLSKFKFEWQKSCPTVGRIMELSQILIPK